MRRKLIIDTDAGGDDAVAIMTALTQPNVEVVAVTCVWGNVDIDQAVENAGKLLDLFERDIPLYRGAAEPLLGVRETVQWGGFGSDGFGDAQFPKSARASAVPKKHAAVALVDIINDIDVTEPDVVWQLICLGPLTNIALAIKLDPNLFMKLGGRDVPGVVVMGGTMESKGNSSLSAEFNMHCDAEAARIVFSNRLSMHPLYLVTWELTVNCAMTWEFYDRWLNRRRLSDGRHVGVEQNRIQIFLEKLFGRLEVFTRPAHDGTKADTGDAESTQDVTCVIPDAVAMVAALQPGFIRDSFDTFVTVELHGTDTRGATLIDWYGNEQSMAKKGRWRNCKVITKANVELFLDMMKSIVAFEC